MLFESVTFLNLIMSGSVQRIGGLNLDILFGLCNEGGQQVLFVDNQHSKRCLSGRIEYLAGFTKESSSLRGTEIFFDNRESISYTGAFGMCQPILFQYILLLPFQEIIAVVSCFIDHLGKLS